jgi:hypothetical protein
MEKITDVTGKIGEHLTKEITNRLCVSLLISLMRERFGHTNVFEMESNNFPELSGEIARDPVYHALITLYKNDPKFEPLHRILHGLHNQKERRFFSVICTALIPCAIAFAIQKARQENPGSDPKEIALLFIIPVVFSIIPFLVSLEAVRNNFSELNLTDLQKLIDKVIADQNLQDLSEKLNSIGKLAEENKSRKPGAPGTDLNQIIRLTNEATIIIDRLNSKIDGSENVNSPAIQNT